MIEANQFPTIKITRLFPHTLVFGMVGRSECTDPLIAVALRGISLRAGIIIQVLIAVTLLDPKILCLNTYLPKLH